MTLTDRIVDSVLATMDLHAVYLGERLGLYRALDRPLTPAELAGRTGTTERYVREWCEQQAVTGILTVADGRFALPDDHRAALLDELSLDHVAPLAKAVIGFAKQTDALVEAFRTGGGVPWSAHGADAHEAQAAANRPLFLGPLATEYLPSVPVLDAAAHGRVAEVGCGHGWAAIGLALAYPDATVDGFDLDAPSIEAARHNAREAGVDDRVRFHLRELSGTGYDLVCAFECVHDLPDPVSVLRAMREAGGEVLVMDEKVAEEFTAPGDDVERLMYGYSLLCCLADGLAHPGSVGTGTVMRPSTLRRYAQEAGFAGVDILPVENDVFRFYRLQHDT